MMSALLPLVGYLLLTLALAVWAQQRAKSGSSLNIVEEYFIGSRSMGGFVLAMTIIASYTSASSFVGGPGVGPPRHDTGPHDVSDSWRAWQEIRYHWPPPWRRHHY